MSRGESDAQKEISQAFQQKGHKVFNVAGHKPPEKNSGEITQQAAQQEAVWQKFMNIHGGFISTSAMKETSTFNSKIIEERKENTQMYVKALHSPNGSDQYEIEQLLREIDSGAKKKPVAYKDNLTSSNQASKKIDDNTSLTIKKTYKNLMDEYFEESGHYPDSLALNSETSIQLERSTETESAPQSDNLLPEGFSSWTQLFEDSLPTDEISTGIESDILKESTTEHKCETQNDISTRTSYRSIGSNTSAPESKIKVFPSQEDTPQTHQQIQDSISPTTIFPRDSRHTRKFVASSSSENVQNTPTVPSASYDSIQYPQDTTHQETHVETLQPRGDVRPQLLTDAQIQRLGRGDFRELSSNTRSKFKSLMDTIPEFMQTGAINFNPETVSRWREFEQTTDDKIRKHLEKAAGKVIVRTKEN